MIYDYYTIVDLLHRARLRRSDGWQRPSRASEGQHMKIENHGTDTKHLYALLTTDSWSSLLPFSVTAAMRLVAYHRHLLRFAMIRRLPEEEGG